MFSALQVVTPPESEPVSSTLAAQHTRIDNDADANLVGIYITAARTWIEEYLNRALVSQQLLWTIARQPPPNSFPLMSVPLTLLVLPQWLQWEVLHQGGGIELPRQPVISVDTVAYGQWGASDTTLVAGTDYDVDPTTSRLRIRPGHEVLPNDHLAITFTTGYPGATLPQPIIHAILMLTAFLYEHRGDAEAEMPSVVTMLLSPYRHITFGG